LDVEAFERQAGQNDDAVIALLPVERHVLVAQPLEALERKAIVGALGFLQAEDVGPHRLDESRHGVDAQPHRIDVPGRDCQLHRMSGAQRSRALIGDRLCRVKRRRFTVTNLRVP
jgi:hypothetical protein